MNPLVADAPPTLTGERTLLRPFAPEDAPAVAAFAAAKEIASTTLAIPHPYTLDMAETWIATHAPGWAAGRLANFAVTEREGGTLVGAVGLMIAPEHRNAEIGYWIGVPFWGRGYATEAARLVIGFGFDALRLHRIHARCFTRNPASARVLGKIGMRHEGRRRAHVLKWDAFEDLDLYGLLATDPRS